LPFREKWRIALAHVRTVLQAGLTLEAVVADAAYGEVAKFRAALERLGVSYVVAVPYSVGARLTAATSSESLAALANSLAPSAWHRIRWGQGTKGPLAARFAAVRVRIPKSRSDRWLLCQESLVDAERQYYFSNLPATTPLKTLVRIARSRWAIDVQYRDLTSELGLDHFEGRSYPGWNHHAVLAAMTFTFLQFERRRRTDPLPSFPEIRNLGPTPPQFASRLPLEALVQWRRLALTTNASFCARVSCFTTYSRASAFPTDRNAS
jgi:SRSO17 transposase